MYKRYLISYSHSRGFGNCFITAVNDFLNNNSTEELMNHIVDSILETTENKYSRDEIVVLAMSNFGELDEMPTM